MSITCRPVDPTRSRGPRGHGSAEDRYFEGVIVAKPALGRLVDPAVDQLTRPGAARGARGRCRGDPSVS